MNEKKKIMLYRWSVNSAYILKRRTAPPQAARLIARCYSHHRNSNGSHINRYSALSKPKPPAKDIASATPWWAAERRNAINKVACVGRQTACSKFKLIMSA